MSIQSRTVALVAASLSLSAISARADNAQPPVDAHPIPVPAAPAPGGNSALPALPVPHAAAATPAPAPAAVVAPSPAMPSDTPPMPSTAAFDPNAAARDARTLNGVLIPTDNGIQASIQGGRSIGAGKQDFLDLLGAGRKAFAFKSGGMFGEKRREVGSAVWFTPGLCGRWLGFIEQRSFADSNVQQADFAALQRDVTAPERTITFLVEMGNLVPVKKHDPPPTLEQANAALAGMSGIHFVLSDDHGVNYAPADVAAPAQVSVRQAFYDDLAVNPQRLVPEITPFTGLSAARLLKRRTPYADYAAFYLVRFAAFNPDGTARINRDTKSVTLRILNGDDVRYATFELSKLP